MKFVTYNIQYSLGKDGNYNLERIVDAVRGADVIALQEVTRNLPQVPDADQPGRIGELLPEYYWIYGPPVDLNASEQDENGAVTNRRLQFGNMLLARWPILSARLFLLPRMRTYDQNSSQCGALEGVIDLPGGPLRVYSVHLNHLNSEERMAQLNYLLPKLLDVPREGGAVSGPGWRDMAEPFLSEDFIVMGDFNLQPDSAEYTRIVGEADYYYGQRIVAHHLVDTWVQAGRPADASVTWYDQQTNFQTGLRLDYGFISAGLATKVKDAWIDDQAPGSDHQPTWFELAL